ncbi:MAG: ATP-binding cassette domain-containing protein [Clostridia bacterium]
MLEVKNLVKIFGEKTAVNNVSFTVQKGKIFGLLGRNGAGKSTIFRLILNILTPTSGTIWYNLDSIDNKVMDTIGYLPEEGSLITTYTVLEQCLYYGALKSMSENDVRHELFKWLKKFDIVEYMNMKIKDLSKGNRQKIQYIIAMLHDPELIILDEPFSGLDPISVEQLKNSILELKEEGKYIIFSSHRMDHVEMLCQDILILDQGNTMLYGELENIKQEYRKKEINLNGNIASSVIDEIKNIDGVLEVQKQGNNTYVIKVEKEDIIKDIFKLLKNSDVVNFYTSKISLNDIFIDKVGTKYEE